MAVGTKKGSQVFFILIDQISEEGLKKSEKEFRRQLGQWLEVLNHGNTAREITILDVQQTLIFDPQNKKGCLVYTMIYGSPDPSSPAH